MGTGRIGWIGWIGWVGWVGWIGWIGWPVDQDEVILIWSQFVVIAEDFGYPCWFDYWQSAFHARCDMSEIDET